MSDAPATKLPRPVFASVFAFPPNRDTLGGTAYLILEKDANAQPANILVDCPAWQPATQEFIAAQGGIRWLFITHRGGMGDVSAIQSALGCEVVIQEQEAYLLPQLDVRSFRKEFSFSRLSRAFWTAGHSPGSACLHHAAAGGILFSGRHLLPNRQGQPRPLRLPKTFHWPRQLRSAQRLLTQFSPDTLSYICPGANTGLLRGDRAIPQAYAQLQAIDWAGLAAG